MDCTSLECMYNILLALISSVGIWKTRLVRLLHCLKITPLLHPVDVVAQPDNADHSTAEPTTVAIWHDEISFDGTGYVELDKKLISHDWDMRMEITLSFSTWSNEGLILWQGSRRQDPTWGYFTSNYMALGSKLKICMC